MKYFIFILVMLSFVSTGCVDINSASLEELKKFNGIGDKKAQAIIDTRPFDSVDDLIKVYGIGPVTLENIKTERLACVSGDVNEVEGVEDEKEKIEEIENVIEDNNQQEKIILLEKPREIISLNDNVESELVYESKNSKIMNWLPYAFSGFLIMLVGFLFWERF